jgi:hypothetical protein
MPWDVPLNRMGMGGVLGYTQPGPVVDNDPLTNAVQPMTDQVMATRARGIPGRVADALLPRMNEQGMPVAPGIGDYINAALWAFPGMRGPRAAMAAEKGAGSGGLRGPKAFQANKEQGDNAADVMLELLGGKRKGRKAPAPTPTKQAEEDALEQSIRELLGK